MPIAMPSTSERLTYLVIVGIGLMVLAALVALTGGASRLVVVVLVLAVALAVYWLAGCSQSTIVGAKETLATAAALWVLCALADLVSGYPYQAVLFLLAAAALGYAYLLLQQGTVPVELRLGGVLAVAAPRRRNYLRMLEELRDAGILTADEFATKRELAGR